MIKKQCNNCEKYKPLSDFYKHPNGKLGVRPNCKECRKKQCREYTRKNKIKCNERSRKYHESHKTHLNKLSNEYYRKRKINEKWLIHYSSAEQRCNNPNKDGYKNYGGRGIKFLLSKQEIKKLWFRDKAYLLKKPSIDRKDNNGHYEFNNCEFIENVKNIAKDKRKPILQFDINGNFIKEWDSAITVKKILNISNKEIS